MTDSNMSSPRKRRGCLLLLLLGFSASFYIRKVCTGPITSLFAVYGSRFVCTDHSFLPGFLFTSLRCPSSFSGIYLSVFEMDYHPFDRESDYRHFALGTDYRHFEL